MILLLKFAQSLWLHSSTYNTISDKIYVKILKYEELRECSKTKMKTKRTLFFAFVIDFVEVLKSQTPFESVLDD